MLNGIKRVFVEKKPNFDVEAEKLQRDLVESLSLKKLEKVRVINRYDVQGIDDSEFNTAVKTIFSEPNVDNLYIDELIIEEGRYFAVEFLPGQYDQRADSAAQCIQILTHKERPIVRAAKVVVLEGDINEDEFEKIKRYYINAVDSREALLEKPETLDMNMEKPETVETLEGFNELQSEELIEFVKEKGLAMSNEDLAFCQKYFREEKRNPTITEIKVIDTYWSDHCRHTTFETVIDEVKFEEGKYSEPIKNAYDMYLRTREAQNSKKNQCLMDIAVIGMKELRRIGKLDDLDVSEEINACSIVVNADVDGKDEEWLVMFKNETHNHPTEIEPFGGASTCLGGAIRDPLSGRSYVYQAMRVTGSADPRRSIEETLPGKLPQIKITREAAKGYSSYGNQIGLATGLVDEIYHDGYMAKRMEIGAVIGAAPKSNVVRRTAEPGDIIILLGGRTGRDGVGGASGSSKEHDESSLSSCGAEVQKGNAPTERKIQRLFRRAEVTTLIVKCNDFGAGGVSVAIGELADGLDINLDAVPKKYDGLDGTEIAISESQERMAVVVPKENVEKLIEYAAEENLEAVVAAEVTDNKRLVMKWNGNSIVDLSRDFLDTNGVLQHTKVVVKAPAEESYFEKKDEEVNIHKGIKETWVNNLKDLNVCSKKGLVEMFDNTIGASTVLMPFGGKYSTTPSEVMASKIPVLNGETSTGTLMSYGFNPYLSSWSPFHGAAYAVLESAAKIAAAGGDARKIRLSFQEYFEKLGKAPEKWGKPFSALLGGLYAQLKLGIPAIGGKDSMSGTFKDINVPPTLTSFAVNVVDVNNVISPEFKEAGRKVVLVEAPVDEHDLPNFDQISINYDRIRELIEKKIIVSAHTVRIGGVSEAITKMAFGNRVGFEFQGEVNAEELFKPKYGSIVVEVNSEVIERLFEGTTYKVLGETIDEYSIKVNGEIIDLCQVESQWKETLETVFPTGYAEECDEVQNVELYKNTEAAVSKVNILTGEGKPRVFIPAFPGTNCEYDSAAAFEKAGANTSTAVFKNLRGKDIDESIERMVNEINKSQIIMIPGGFSAGDEPDGSGKFIATAFRNPRIKEAVMNMLNQRDGLMIGICNGFQSLIKLGLVPYGEIREIDESCPTLTYNKIGKHMSAIIKTKVISNKSPWFSSVNVGDIHNIPISHGEGRFVASEEMVKKLLQSGQVATMYVDNNGNPTTDIKFNPNGSVYGIEGITSPDGRILGKMGHSERIGKNLYKNIYGEMDQKLFESGVKYFK